ncbi:hypothetical protein CISG_06100 [Coccidioides immitis RMSCC 3703]|uniref:Uncharacterized protein n=1 Tax=Coccidioides immitis RMSCC 3703 TaxID=454286 RepID=A0A0J8QXS4_COCIT|nr:hypothetical protein CISG_06100 [Coccidioides immitis RMSCC 3703]
MLDEDGVACAGRWSGSAVLRSSHMLWGYLELRDERRSYHLTYPANINSCIGGRSSLIDSFSHLDLPLLVSVVSLHKVKVTSTSNLPPSGSSALISPVHAY